MPKAEFIISLSGDSAITRISSTTCDWLRYPVVRAAPVAAFFAPGWPRVLDNGIHSAVGIGDLDDDGRPEIGVGLRDGQVLILDGQGTPLPGWPRSAANAATLTPLLVDLTHYGLYDQMKELEREGLPDPEGTA